MKIRTAIQCLWLIANVGWETRRTRGFLAHFTPINAKDLSLFLTWSLEQSDTGSTSRESGNRSECYAGTDH